MDEKVYMDNNGEKGMGDKRNGEKGKGKKERGEKGKREKRKGIFSGAMRCDLFRAISKSPLLRRFSLSPSSI